MTAVSQSPVVTIDGPGGSGKGTIALRLADRLGWWLLDSGVLYRLVALAAMKQDIGLDEPARLGVLARHLDVRFGTDARLPRIQLGDEEVAEAVRSEAVGTFASRVAALPEVREALVERQRAFRQPPGLVADGRDMGTVIFPDAALKIFLTATVAERAKRRYKQLKEKGESVNLSRLFQDIEKRDQRDRSRAIAPLVPASDAHIIDSTDLGIEEVLRRVLDLLRERKIAS